MIEATGMEHLQPGTRHPDPMDISDSSTTGASPRASTFPELLPFATTPSFHMGADCSLLLSPVSSVASPPMQHVVKQYAIFSDTALAHLPSPPNSGKIFYPHWNTSFAMDQGPGPNDDVAIPPEFYMQERCTPDPESFLGNYNLADASQTALNQPAHYFAPVPHLGSNGPPMVHSGTVQSGDSQNTLATSSEVKTPGDAPMSEIVTPTRTSRKRSVPTTPEAKKEYDDSESHDDTDSDEAYSSSRRDSNSEGKKPRKRAAPKRPSASRTPPVDILEYQNCFGDLVAPQLKDNCPKEERCIFMSRWKHREKKGQDMWDSIQEDFYNEFQKESCKETLQMKLTRGRPRYIQWTPEDEGILMQAWMNVERSRYKFIMEEFYKLGGSRNMLLNPGDIEFKAVVDLGLEEELYVEGINEMEIRRRCRFLAGKKKAGNRNAEEPGISYRGPSLLGRVIDEDEVIDQVVAQQLSGATRKPFATRRKRQNAKPTKGPKRLKVERE
ncbi:hypothetical protein CRV24_002870 [Beauveria bassiana]|nr:hypothetical protein CRV24_002870 [Beauveria bassiana]